MLSRSWYVRYSNDWRKMLAVEPHDSRCGWSISATRLAMRYVPPRTGVPLSWGPNGPWTSPSAGAAASVVAPAVAVVEVAAGAAASLPPPPPHAARKVAADDRLIPSTVAYCMNCLRLILWVTYWSLTCSRYGLPFGSGRGASRYVTAISSYSRAVPAPSFDRGRYTVFRRKGMG